MIKVRNGSIFDRESEVLVNPVNCVGVMGKGLASEFRKRYPTNFRAYKEACNKGEVRVGGLFVTSSSSWPSIVNFPTKTHWRERSHIGDIVSGLIALRAYILDNKVSKLSIPAVGCGLGGLSWQVVEPHIYHALDDLKCEVSLYPPSCG